MNREEPRLSVVVPVFNEYGNVRPLAGEISDALNGRLSFEVIFVDDCSADDTLAEIDQTIKA